jgi:protein-disulfide isomerase
MNKGSAIVAIIIAAVIGFVGGQLSAKRGGGETTIADASKDDVAAVGAVAGVQEDEPVERLKVPVTNAQPQRGPTEAPVTIVAFSDFECPFCGRVLPTLEQLEKEYGNKIRVVWRNQPLPFHQNAMPAAQAAMEAFAQGKSEKFWKMHDTLFAHRDALTRPDLEKYAGELGLDVAKFKTALDSNKHEAAIKADMELGNSVGARGTPSFFINGRSLRGAQPVDKFKELIDDELKRVDKLKAKKVPAAAVYATLMASAKEKAEAAPERAAAAPDDKTVYKVPVGDKDPVKGPADALVTVVIFSDYQCPFCSRVEPTLAALAQKYGNDVRFVWKDNPLPFHQDAGPAATLAREAYEQGKDKKFWEAHDLLFQNQRALSRADLEGYGKQLGLNEKKLKAALDSNPYKAKIEEDQALARNLGASGTPSFFINGRSLRGAQPQPAFEKLIDEELAKAKAKVQSGVARAKIYEELTKDGATKPVAAPAAPAAAAAPDANKVYDIAVAKDAPIKGGKNAKVVIQEFSDFQCPFCGRVNPTIKQVMDEYKDKIKIVWRNYPLPFHENAGPAAQAAHEVFEQGGNEKFWAYHDLLFANQTALTRADLEKYAEQVGGINVAKFKAALDNKTHEARVKADMEAVDKAGARIGTPSFFINGKLLQGAQPVDAFKAAIDDALKAK